jgi:hypothetical protein
MLKKAMCLAAFGAALWVAPAAAQDPRVTVDFTAGWSFADGVSGDPRVVLGVGTFDRIDPKDSFKWGFGVGALVGENAEVGFLYGQAASTLQISGPGTAGLPANSTIVLGANAEAGFPHRALKDGDVFHVGRLDIVLRDEAQRGVHHGLLDRAARKSLDQIARRGKHPGAAETIHDCGRIEAAAAFEPRRPIEPAVGLPQALGDPPQLVRAPAEQRFRLGVQRLDVGSSALAERACIHNEIMAMPHDSQNTASSMRRT